MNNTCVAVKKKKILPIAATIPKTNLETLQAIAPVSIRQGFAGKKKSYPQPYPYKKEPNLTGNHKPHQLLAKKTLPTAAPIQKTNLGTIQATPVTSIFIFKQYTLLYLYQYSNLNTRTCITCHITQENVYLSK